MQLLHTECQELWLMGALHILHIFAAEGHVLLLVEKQIQESQKAGCTSDMEGAAPKVQGREGFIL